MSLETLLTLGTAAAILLLALVLRTIAMGTIGVVRFLTGRPVRRGLPQAVARTSWSERAGRIYEGAAALLVFVAASIAGAVRTLFASLRPVVTWSGRAARWLGVRMAGWWREAAQPSLVEAREAGIALVTQHPETSGQVEVFAQTSPVLGGNGSSPSAPTEATREMQLV